MARRQRRLWLILSSLLILGLLLTSCAPAAAPTPASRPTSAPSKAETPAAKPPAAPTAPSPSPKPPTDQPKYGGVLTISLSADPPSLDALQESGLDAHAPLAPCYNGLLQYDPLKNDKVIGDLADTWEISKDGLEYTFRLQKEVKFHDGPSLNSKDAKFSLERQYDAPKGLVMPRKEIFDAVRSVDAPDDLTLKIAMKTPQYAFIPQLARGENVVFSKAFAEAKGHMKNDVMGTGPFKLKQYNMASQFEVVKFPQYFVKGRPYLDGIVFYIIRDASTRFAAFRTGRIKMTSPGGAVLAPSEAALVESQLKGKAVAQRFMTLVWHELVFNCTKGPAVDLRVRQAISLAIDRQKAVEVALEGSGQVGGPMAPGTEWAIPQDELLKMPGYRQPKDADMAEARKLLAEAGYPNGFQTTWPVRRGREYETAAVFLKDQVAKIGIEAKIDLQEYAVFGETRRQATWDMFPGTMGMRIADPDDPARSYVTGGSYNFGKFSDAKVDELFAKQGATLDSAERRKVSIELQKRILETVSRTVNHWVDRYMGYWLMVKDYKPGVGQYNNNKHANIWLSE